MRYLALVVGIAMIAIGVIVEIGPFLAFGGPGSFTCGDARACDFLGPLPFFFGGGVVLIGVGIFVLVVAASAFALRSATGTAERWSRLVRMDRFGSHTHDRSTSATTWHVTSSGEHQIPNELAPMIDGLLSGLHASGLIGPDAGTETTIDPTTGLPMAIPRPLDARSDDERARDLRATGTLGRITVHGFRELPASAAGGQLVELRLEVAPEGRPSYRLRHFALVPPRWKHRLATGAGLPVWVDAADPSRLLIDWERA